MPSLFSNGLISHEPLPESKLARYSHPFGREFLVPPADHDYRPSDQQGKLPSGLGILVEAKPSTKGDNYAYSISMF